MIDNVWWLSIWFQLYQFSYVPRNSYWEHVTYCDKLHFLCRKVIICMVIMPKRLRYGVSFISQNNIQNVKTDDIFVSFQLIALLVRHHRKKLPDYDHMVPEELTKEVSYCYFLCAIQTNTHRLHYWCVSGMHEFSFSKLFVLWRFCTKYHHPWIDTFNFQNFWNVFCRFAQRTDTRH